MDILLNPYIYYIVYYGSLILFLIALFYIISSARQNGLDNLGVKHSITSFLLTILTYFSFQTLALICYFAGCNGRPKIFTIPVDLWLLLILFILSLVFSIKARRAGSKSLSTLLIVWEILVVISTLMSIIAAAWINALL